MPLNKEEYIAMRELEEVPLSLFYEYYIEKGGTFPLITFEKAFPNFCLQVEGKTLFTNTGIKHFSLDRILQKIYYYYNKKFGE